MQDRITRVSGMPTYGIGFRLLRRALTNYGSVVKPARLPESLPRITDRVCSRLNPWETSDGDPFHSSSGGVSMRQGQRVRRHRSAHPIRGSARDRASRGAAHMHRKVPSPCRPRGRGEGGCRSFRTSASHRSARPRAMPAPGWLSWEWRSWSSDIAHRRWCRWRRTTPSRPRRDTGS